MMKIKKPNWSEMIISHGAARWSNADKWFAEHIAPYEFYDPSATEEMLGHKEGDDGWYMFSADRTDAAKCGHTHRALLVGIEPIKKDTAEDVLRDILKEYDDDIAGGSYVVGFGREDKNMERARKVLRND